MHNYVYHITKLPTVFSSYLGENKIMRHYNTRQKDVFHLHIVHSETGKTAIKYKGSKRWNNLLCEIINIQAAWSFKLTLKKYLLHSLDSSMCVTCTLHFACPSLSLY